MSYLKKSKEITRIDFKEENFLNDALKSVCLLVEDGLFLTFSHRSFQEYFTAKFIVNSREDIQEALLNKYKKYFWSDNVINLVHEVDNRLVEKYVLIPYIESLERMMEIKKTFGVTHYLKFIKAIFTEVLIENESVIYYGTKALHENHSFIKFILKNYGEVVGADYNSKYHDRNNKIVERYGVKGKVVKKKVSEFTIRNELFLDVANSGNIFSMEAVNDLLKIKKAIIDDHKSFNSSLDEILNI